MCHIKASDDAPLESGFCLYLSNSLLYTLRYSSRSIHLYTFPPYPEAPLKLLASLYPRAFLRLNGGGGVFFLYTCTALPLLFLLLSIHGKLYLCAPFFFVSPCEWPLFGLISTSSLSKFIGFSRARNLIPCIRIDFFFFSTTKILEKAERGESYRSESAISPRCINLHICLSVWRSPAAAIHFRAVVVVPRRH